MSDWNSVKEEVLIKCKRYCCYCERYRGHDIEVHHIIPRSKGGKDDFDNAIPLCYDCHSEIGSYNSKHPKENRFKPGELKRIRDEFYDKAKKFKRRPEELSLRDEDLLRRLRKNYTNIIDTLNELQYYLSDEFMRYHENSGQLIFRNSTLEEGTRLQNDFRPASIRIREQLSDILKRLYDVEDARQPEQVRHEKMQLKEKVADSMSYKNNRSF